MVLAKKAVFHGGLGSSFRFDNESKCSSWRQPLVFRIRYRTLWHLNADFLQIGKVFRYNQSIEAAQACLSYQNSKRFMPLQLQLFRSTRLEVALKYLMYMVGKTSSSYECIVP